MSLLFHGTTTNVNSTLKLCVFNFCTWFLFFGRILGFHEMGFVEFHYWHINMVFNLCSRFLYLIVFCLYFGVSWNGFCGISLLVYKYGVQTSKFILYFFFWWRSWSFIFQLLRIWYTGYFWTLSANFRHPTLLTFIGNVKLCLLCSNFLFAFYNFIWVHVPISFLPSFSLCYGTFNSMFCCLDFLYRLLWCLNNVNWIR